MIKLAVWLPRDELAAREVAAALERAEARAGEPSALDVEPDDGGGVRLRIVAPSDPAFVAAVVAAAIRADRRAGVKADAAGVRWTLSSAGVLDDPRAVARREHGDCADLARLAAPTTGSVAAVHLPRERLIHVFLQDETGRVRDPSTEAGMPEPPAGTYRGAARAPVADPAEEVVRDFVASVPILPRSRPGLTLRAVAEEAARQGGPRAKALRIAATASGSAIDRMTLSPDEASLVGEAVHAIVYGLRLTPPSLAPAPRGGVRQSTIAGATRPISPGCPGSCGARTRTPTR